MFVSTNFFPCFKSIMFRYDFRRNGAFLDIVTSLIKDASDRGDRSQPTGMISVSGSDGKVLETL